MMELDKIPKEERDACYRQIHSSIVAGKGKDQAIRKKRDGGIDFVNLLDPYSLCPKPASKAGMFPRIPTDHIKAWVNTPRIAKYFCKTSAAYFFSKWKFKRADIVDFVEHILSRIGAESYLAEWSNPRAQDWLDTLERQTMITDEANRVLSLSLDEKLEYHLSSNLRDGKKLFVYDAGTGGGSTIRHVLNRINELMEEGRVRHDYWDYLRIFLQDVSQESLDYTARMLREKVHFTRDNTPPQLIHKICENFVNLHENEKISGLKGSIDLLVSGAAICHQTDFPPFFKLMSELLADDGEMHIWDWYNGPSWRAPYLRLAKEDEKGNAITKDVYHIWQRGSAHPYRLDVFDGNPLDNVTREILYDRMEAAGQYIAVYEMSREDAKIVLKNYKTLLGVLGWVKKGKRGEEDVARKVKAEYSGGCGEMDVDEYLEMRFNHDIERGEYGFNYLEFIKNLVVKNMLDDPTPLEGECPYYLVEGTGRIYTRDMKGFFSNRSHTPFLDMRKSVWSRDGGTYVDVDAAYQILYSSGRKKRDLSLPPLFL
jgi:SAM-dependent methyltransferase